MVEGGARGVENTQKSQNTRGSPLIKRSEVGGGYKSHQGKQIPLSRNRILGPGALMGEPYRPSWPHTQSPFYTFLAK